MELAGAARLCATRTPVLLLQFGAMARGLVAIAVVRALLQRDSLGSSPDGQRNFSASADLLAERGVWDELVSEGGSLFGREYEEQWSRCIRLFARVKDQNPVELWCPGHRTQLRLRTIWRSGVAVATP